MVDDYTDRKIAIFTDAHGLLEPTKAALEDMKKRKITEIYSLGDNIGFGPNPNEVIDLLHEYGVISIAGNAEEYVTLGIEPFQSYFHSLKKMSQSWTLSKLNEQQIGRISLYPHSIELLIGGKKLALCHFANDVRIDFNQHNTWSYQRNIANGSEAYWQFLYTNSLEQIHEVTYMIEKFGSNHPFVQGYLSSQKDPLFKGKQVNFFDAVIQGHVHWKIYEKSNSTKFYSIRAVGMAYHNDPIDTASYIILHEKKIGYDIEEVLVQYDREKMISSILSSTNPDKTIQKFTRIR